MWQRASVEGGRALLPETPTPGFLLLFRPPSMQADFTHHSIGALAVVGGQNCKQVGEPG